MPVWGKILSSTTNKPTTIKSRSGGDVTDISFIPLRDTLSGIIKSYIAVYHLENDAFGYRLYNRDSVTLFIPANPTEKPKVVRMLAVYAYFEQTVNNRAETFIPRPYNITFRNIQIGFGSVIRARTECQEVCIEGEGIISPIALVAGRICWNVCTYGANEPNTGSGGCALCGSSGWTGSGTGSGGSNGLVSSSLTLLDGLISNSTFLSDLSSALDPDGMPEADFTRKFPEYAYLIAPLRQLRAAMYNPNISFDMTDLALFARNPALITQLNAFFSQGGSVADGVLHKNLLKDDIGYFNANKDAGFPAIGSSEWEQAVKDPILISQYLYTQYISECIILKKLYPFASDSDIRWTAFKNTLNDATHVGLDILGMFPVVGEAADLTNGVIYTIQGDGVNATLSYLSAVPFIGWASTGTKYAVKFVKNAAGETIKLGYKFENGLINWGSRSNLRKALNLAPVNIDPRQAHHLIDWAAIDNPVVQRAGFATKTNFHMNQPSNGIAIDAWRNQHNHSQYNQAIENNLYNIGEVLKSRFGKSHIEDLDPEEVSKVLTRFQSYLQNQINQYSNLHLNQIPLNTFIP